MSAGKGKNKERARQAGYDAGYEDALSLAPDSRDRLVDVDDLAEDTGLNPRVFKTLRRLGVGPQPVRMGGRYAYRLSDVDAWRADERWREEDEKQAVAEVLDMFATVRAAFLS